MGGWPRSLKIAINSMLRKTGYEIRRFRSPSVENGMVPDAYSTNVSVPPDFSEKDRSLWERIRPYTMTDPEEVFSLCRAIEYLEAAEIPGEFIECGVWRGGSAMVMALTLLDLASTRRHLYLYDTFEDGFPSAGEEDVSIYGETPCDLWQRSAAAGWTVEAFTARVDSVRETIQSTGYPMDRIHLVKGRVEKTIPEQAPQAIALLRLDTDWYESTVHEMEHLYPRLSRGGIFIQDDYGLLRGARKATDEYFDKHGVKMLLHRVNSGGYRIGIKQ